MSNLEKLRAIRNRIAAVGETRTFKAFMEERKLTVVDMAKVYMGALEFENLPEDWRDMILKAEREKAAEKDSGSLSA